MKIKKIFAILTAVCMLLLAGSFPAFGEEPPEGFSSWEEYYDYLIYGETVTEDVTNIEDMTLVGSNSRFDMYYNEGGADVYLKEKATDKIWGSAVYGDYIDTKELSPNAVSNLLTVCYSDKENNVLEKDLISASGDDFSLETQKKDDAIIITVTMNETEISFDVELSLVEDGLKVNIPYKSIKETKENKLLSIRLLPLMGAAAPGENGYLFYPDGSGALMNIKDYRKEQPEFYNYPIYCTDEANFETFDSNKTQDIKNLMLPVFGVKHTKGGVFAEIVSGSENASLHMSVDYLYQSYFELVYRTSNTVTYEFSSSKGQVSKVGAKNMKGDRTVIYHILEEKDNTYSDMANLYRDILVDRGELTSTLKGEGVPLSVEFFSGIAKNGILGKKIQSLTSFKDAEDIAKDIMKIGVEKLDIMLKGWCDGGYDTLPTASDAEKVLGGQSDLNNLIKTVKNANGNVYLYSDLINADIKTGNFNSNKHTVRDDIDTVITDGEGKRHWLDPKFYMSDGISSLMKKQKNANICLANVGSWLLSNTGETVSSDRGEVASAINSAISKAKANGSVAVTGGNSYILKNADRLYEIPDNDSGYYQTDRTVPFYQMVIHGYKNYSSLAANLSYDYKYQKLRFVETGSIPHFIITKNSPNLLQGTSFDDIFSSEYSDWKSTIKDMWSDINNRLGSVWNLTMVEHEYLNDKLVCVTYSDNSKVYINYSSEAISVAGVDVPAMDFVLVKGS